jgi:hypothetical protein
VVISSRRPLKLTLHHVSFFLTSHFRKIYLVVLSKRLRLSALVILYIHSLKRIFCPGHRDFILYPNLGQHIIHTFYITSLPTHLQAPLPCHRSPSPHSPSPRGGPTATFSGRTLRRQIWRTDEAIADEVAIYRTPLQRFGPLSTRSGRVYRTWCR